MGLIERFLTFVISLAGLLTAVAAIAFWLRVRPASVAARRALFAVLALYSAASMYVVSHAVSRVLVVGFSELEVSAIGPGPMAVVVLGSGAPTHRGRDGARLTFLDPQGAQRVLEGYRAYRMAPDAWVISSGGTINSSVGAPTTGGSMRDALVRLGVPSSRILVEGTSQSTRDEAVLVRSMLEQIGVKRVILVTSEHHMRRARATFNAVGIDVVPAIAPNPMAAGSWSDWLWPSSQTLTFSSSLVREFAAIAAYWARGWL